jgi:hypothetical protein
LEGAIQLDMQSEITSYDGASSCFRADPGAESPGNRLDADALSKDGPKGQCETN